MRTKTFAEIRRKAPPIFVSRGKETYILRPEEWDERYGAEQYDSYWIEGSGSRDYPYIYVRASEASWHHAVVYLWFRFRRRKQPVFIRVSEWLLRVEQTWVRAANNWFTRLLPLPSERRA